MLKKKNTVQEIMKRTLGTFRDNFHFSCLIKISHPSDVKVTNKHRVNPA
jgi:hypothetical protein